MFVDRLRELESMNKILANSPALFVLYGRRRVGKTELLQHFYRDRPHVYYLGDLSSSSTHVRALSSRIGDHLGDNFLRSQSLSDWRGLLEYLRNRKAELDLVLDEFPYLVEADPTLPSLLQSAWDQGWRDAPTRLTLCGSSVGFMEREVLAERSPLFGRRTAQMRLRPMNFWDAREFFQHLPLAEQVEVYACFGGVPAYLKRLGDSPLFETIAREVLDPSSYLYDEPRFLLQQELREPRNYFSLLTSVARGGTRLNEIAQDSGMTTSFASRYLDTLSRLELIQRVVPVTEKNPERSRKGLYRICDPYLRFWFRFVQGSQSELESGRWTQVMERKIKPGLASFVAASFEEICRQWVALTAPSFTPDRVGGWWTGDAEIDVVAYDDRHALFGECKWTNQPVAASEIEKLRARAARVSELADRKPIFAVFSKSGFGRLSPDVLRVGLEDLAAC
ncbi:ATP-binding protein [bacterium CPR1]|nr:ATP-binding protein [bacterium CPR1]